MKRFLLTSLVVLSFNTFAQSSNSVQTSEPTIILTGAVYDINGAVIVGTSIITYGTGGKNYETTTNAEGIYKINLPLGIYKIKVSAPGFCSFQVERFVVVNSTYGKMSLDLVLEVSEPQEGCKPETTIEKKSKRKAEKKSKTIIE